MPTPSEIGSVSFQFDDGSVADVCVLLEGHTQPITLEITGLHPEHRGFVRIPLSPEQAIALAVLLTRGARTIRPLMPIPGAPRPDPSPY